MTTYHLAYESNTLHAAATDAAVPGALCGATELGVPQEVRTVTELTLVAAATEMNDLYLDSIVRTCSGCRARLNVAAHAALSA